MGAGGYKIVDQEPCIFIAAQRDYYYGKNCVLIKIEFLL